MKFVSVGDTEIQIARFSRDNTAREYFMFFFSSVRYKSMIHSLKLVKWTHYSNLSTVSGMKMCMNESP